MHNNADAADARYEPTGESLSKKDAALQWFEHGFSDRGNIGGDYVRSVLAHYFNTTEQLKKEVVVTRKVDNIPLSCSVLDLEAHQLEETQPDVWQTDISLGTNRSRAYSIDAVSRGINELIDEIVDRKSKNGVTLLSAAPKGDGTLPELQVDALREIGGWTAINKPVLYAARPAKFVKGGVDVAEAGSLRFTMKCDFLYAIDL